METGKMTKNEVYEIAKKRGIKNRSKMTKKELIEAVKKSESIDLQKISGASTDSISSGKLGNTALDIKEKEPEISLPFKYNKDTLVFLPIDPVNAYAFWELSEDTLSKYGNMAELDQVRPVLSFFSGEGERLIFSPVDVVGNYYINDVRMDDSVVWAELSFLDKNGEKIIILSSEKVKMPSDRISKEEGGEFMQVNESTKKLMEYSAAADIIFSSNEYLHRKLKMFSSYDLPERGNK